jgi:hypothetical protein
MGIEAGGLLIDFAIDVALIEALRLRVRALCGIVALIYLLFSQKSSQTWTARLSPVIPVGQMPMVDHIRERIATDSNPWLAFPEQFIEFDLICPKC